jgi:hypothetical protein
VIISQPTSTSGQNSRNSSKNSKNSNNSDGDVKEKDPLPVNNSNADTKERVEVNEEIQDIDKSKVCQYLINQ